VVVEQATHFVVFALFGEYKNTLFGDVFDSEAFFLRIANDEVYCYGVRHSKVIESSPTRNQI